MPNKTRLHTQKAMLKGVTTGGQGGHNSPGAESLRGVLNDCGVGGEKSQECHKYFLKYSTFASKRPQVRTWGRQTCFFSPGAI